jgi:outer membrane protein, adhesin transport system
VNTNNIDGHREEYSGKVVLSWDIFTGGQTSWRRAEQAERMIEQTERHARLQRAAFESIDRAWAARTITSERAAALNRQVNSARSVVNAYSKEYELGQRTLIDLLNAENQLFNAMVNQVSTRGVAVFADYQLLAAMGKLLEYLKSPLPDEAEPCRNIRSVSSPANCRR